MTILTDRIAEVLKAELATWTDHQGNWFVHANNENVSIAALAYQIAEDLGQQGILAKSLAYGRCSSCSCDTCEPMP